MHDDISFLINDLNDPQRQAVAAPLGRQLVLAGAGSGKTRVLVHRIAWLHHVEQASLYSILSVTFTNKAAAEMRQRIQGLLGSAPYGMWVGTFHGLAHRLLRAHWQEARLDEHFQILDSDDQLRIVKRVMRELGLDEQRWPAKQAQWFINGQKDEGYRPKHIQSSGDTFLTTMVSVYQAYEEACARAGVIDFSELLLRALDLWRDHPDLLAHYQKRFRHVLVDEFQDTNRVQYAWLQLLANGGDSLMVVGDDDQSIYGWRGARVENIYRFSDDFKDAQTIRLEQNYRSTGTILKAANGLIANNDQRMGKELWTDGDQGEPLSLYAAFNEHDEARYVVDTLQSELKKRGLQRQDCAILYRSNAQSRVLEEALLREKIPYRIYGGLRFFERAEIKNAMAYMRLLQTRDNDAALERIINLPTRGIGEKTVENLRELARAEGISLWAAIHEAVGRKLLSGRAAGALNGFVELIDQLALDTEGQELHDLTRRVIEQSGLWAFHRDEKGEKAQARLENLEELVSAAKAFVMNEEDGEYSSELAAFLDHASLEAGEQQAAEHEDSVQLMTLHSAKGLEFPLVFLVGMEEGLFPHKMSLEEPGRLAEERRLAYVGITRAMQQLYMTYAETRRLYGNETYNKVSRFVRELPSDVVQEVRLNNSVSRRFESRPATATQGFANATIPDTEFRLGQRVQHALFGEGVILNFEGSGAQARVQVNFESEGTKWLMLTYAKLVAC